MKPSNKYSVILLAFTVSACNFSGSHGSTEENNTVSTDTLSTEISIDSTIRDTTQQDTAIMKENPLFEIHTTLGTITVMLYRETPAHLKNFDKLVGEHFYDSILFHRIIPGFMIQTGDPLSKDPSKASEYGSGGPGYTIPAEIDTSFHHKKGALAAARRGDLANPERESSGSQFYIVQDEAGCSHLDGQYTIFGETVDGFEVIDKIAHVQTDSYDRPLQDVRIISITKIDEI